jgi:hypothetical protein
MSELQPSVTARTKPALRKHHFIMCAAFSVVGLASWQGLVWSRHNDHRNLVGLFALVCLICLFGATQSIALPIVYKRREAQGGEETLAEFSSNTEMQNVAALAEEFYLSVLRDDEKPLFVSDEATLFDVWSGDMNEVLNRCSQFYGVPVSLEDARQPFWKLLLMLNSRRPT